MRVRRVTRRARLPLRIVRHVPAGERKCTTMASVTFDNATRLYPGSTKPAVDALNLDVGDGEFLVLVGPSGCGKSTSLRMLAGLEDVNAGRILIGDRDVTQLPPKDRDIAMVFQSYALYPHMSVADNMGFALKIAGVNKQEIRQRVEEAARILDLTQHGLPVEVDVVEELGADAYIYGRAADSDMQIIARTDGRRPPEKGSTVHFTPKPGHVHLFDTANGER